jgi:hypothetical protein
MRLNQIPGSMWALWIAVSVGAGVCYSVAVVCVLKRWPLLPVSFIALIWTGFTLTVALMTAQVVGVALVAITCALTGLPLIVTDLVMTHERQQETLQAAILRAKREALEAIHGNENDLS